MLRWVFTIGYFKLALVFVLSTNKQSKPTIFSWVVRSSSHMGAEKYPTVGSSGEYWSMN